jgi:hypothetical protein
MKLNQKEEDFIRYWSVQRQNKKQFLRKKSIGLPLGVLIVVLVLINLYSGWYQRADMELRSDSSLFIVILIASFGIVVFITIFGANHRWDQNELYYQELMKKKGQQGPDAAGLQ